MSEVGESVRVGASLAETWDYFFDRRNWPAWVDGFGAVVAVEGYPEEGTTLRWRSGPAGRGEVVEKVLEHHPRRIHRVQFSDSQTSGELRTTFEVDGSGTRVSQSLDYALRDAGPFAWASDRLFIRSQQRGSLQRSLLRLRREVEEAARFGE